MKRFKYLALAAVVALGACDEGGDLVVVDEDPITGSLTVTVTASSENVNATVEINGPVQDSEATGADGTVTFPDLPEGAYAISISGFDADFVFSQTSGTRNITEANPNPTIAFTGSVITTASVSGQVTAGGTGVSGVLITATRAGGGSAQDITGPSGNYLIPTLRSGSYTVTMSAFSSAQATCTETSQAKEVGAGQNVTANFTCTEVVAPPDPPEPTVSIAEITEDEILGGSAPIDQSDVSGQIEIAVNIDRDGGRLLRVDALIGANVVASQIFSSGSVAASSEAPAGQFETIVLNVPTDQVSMDEDMNIFPTVQNGAQNISVVAIFESLPQGVPSNSVPVIMNNPDRVLLVQGDIVWGAAAGATSAQDGGGATWWKGDGELSGVRFLSFSGVTPTHVEFDLENDPTSLAGFWGVGVCDEEPSSAFIGTPETGLLVTNTHDCDGEGDATVDIDDIQDVDYPSGAIGPDGSDLAFDFDPALLGAQFFVSGSTDIENKRNFLIDASAGSITNPDEVNFDALAPTVEVHGHTTGSNRFGVRADDTRFVAFNRFFDEQWVNASTDLFDFVEFDDDGVGVAAGFPTLHLFTGSCTGSAVTVGGDLTETVASDGTPDGHRLCAMIEDKLANSRTSTESNFFGADFDAPSVRLHGTTGATPTITASYGSTTTHPLETADAISATSPFTIFNIADTWDDGGGDDFAWGLEAQDGRSGFHQEGTAVDFLPATQTLVRTLSTGATPCPTSDTDNNELTTVLSDLWIRTEVELDFVCGLAPDLGIFRYEGFVTDRAGNESDKLEFVWGIDDVAEPVATALVPNSVGFDVGSDIMVQLFASDDVEINEVRFSATYPSVEASTFEVIVHSEPISVGTRFDGFNPFNSSLWTAALSPAQLAIPGDDTFHRVDYVCVGNSDPYSGCAEIGAGDGTGDGDVLADEDEYNDQDTNGTFGQGDDGDLDDAGDDVNGDGVDDLLDRVPQTISGVAIDFGMNDPSNTVFFDISPFQWGSSTGMDAPWNDLEILELDEENGDGTWRVQVLSSVVDSPFDDVRLFAVAGITTDEIADCGSVGAGNRIDLGAARFFVFQDFAPAAENPCLTVPGGVDHFRFGAVVDNKLLLSGEIDP